MHFNAARLLRTPHSERFLIRQGPAEVAAVDLHFLLDGRVAGTATLFEGHVTTDHEVQALLEYIDEELLPDVARAEDNLLFTVVRGRVIGSFSPSAAEDEPAPPAPQ